MTPLYILAGVGVGIVALAALIVAFAVLVRAVASLLPPASQFIGDLQNLREWTEQRAEQARRRQTESPAPGEGPGPAGVAPAPVFDRHRVAPPVAPDAEGPTSANLPPVIVGDVDRFDAEVGEEVVARPLAEGSRHAARPPGEPIEGEEGFRG